MRSATPTLSILALLSLLAAGCLLEGRPLANTDQDTRMTFLHTSDWHSRLLPYEFEPPRSDQELGLASDHRPFGGLARMATLLKRERAAAERVLHVDSGDCFQGAPIFNFYKGEVEIKSMSLAGVDAAVIGNHEFDAGIRNITEQLRRHARYPVVGANYVLPDFLEGTQDIGLGDVVHPFTILNSGGVRVGVIGGANISSLSSIGEGGSSLGIQPLDEVQAIQDWITFLEPQVDLTILVSHMGLNADERVIRETIGLDLVFGGHHHIVLNPPKVIEDLVGRPVPLVHSGAFMKYVGKLDVVVNSGSVVSHDYTLFPIDSATWGDHCPAPGSRGSDRQAFCPAQAELPREKLAQRWLPDDNEALRMLEPYVLDMNRNIDLKGVVAYSPQRVGRFGVTSGDSALGNLVTGAMLARERVEADFALTNSLGIRTDFHQGPVTLEQMFNVFPFENSITKILLSGQEIVEMLDFVARRSAGRGCQSQAQVAGLTFRMNCVDQFTLSWSDLVYVGPPRCLAALDHGEGTKIDFPGLSDPAEVTECQDAVRKIVGKRGSRLDRCDITPLSFDAAVNDYIAGGGSGFEVLKFNTAKTETGVSQRDAVIDHMKKLPACKTLSAEVVADCVTDLQDLFRRECRRLTGPDLIACTERAFERADGRCHADLPCVAGEADGRIGQVFVDSADVIPICADADTSESALISEPDDVHDHAWGVDEACNG